MYERLLEFKAENGHCCVPQRYVEDRKLAMWVNVQRKSHKRGHLRQERIEKLEKAGFAWCVTAHEPWESVYKRLVKFKEEHGNCLVPCSYPPDPKLGNWVQRHRQFKNVMDEDRIAKLDAIGFEWSVKKNQEDEQWDRMYWKLTRFREEHGHCEVPKSYVEDPSLGGWVSRQRTLAARKKIQEARFLRLSALGFSFFT